MQVAMQVMLCLSKCSYEYAERVRLYGVETVKHVAYEGGAVASARLALHDHAAVLRERRPDVVRHEACRVLRVVRAPVPARYRKHEYCTLYCIL